MCQALCSQQGAKWMWSPLSCGAPESRETDVDQIITVKNVDLQILPPVEQKQYSQKDRQDEKAEDCVPDEGTR